VTTLAFSNFSHALGKLGGKQAGKSGGSYGVTVMDYSKQELSTSADKRTEVGGNLAAAGVELEKAFGGPQDVEGAFVGGDIYIVQTRPQP
jgi:phosphoglucan,water dikinase